jgi:NADPH:quinone reductase-like Zn-dependent oxidoreductase
LPLPDGAGEVAAIGDGVTRVKVGDRIIGTFHPRWFGGPIKPDYLTVRLGNLEGHRRVTEGILEGQPNPLWALLASRVRCLAE